MQIRDWNNIRSAKKLTVDTETTGLNCWKGDAPFMVDFLEDGGNHLTFEWPVDPYTRTVLPDKFELEMCAEILGNQKISKTYHNAKFDIRMFDENYGIKTEGRIDDTLFMSHICDSLGSLGLKTLCIKFGLMSNDDERILHQETIRARRIGKKEGWWLGKVVVEDYWMPKAVNPKSGTCRYYCRCDTERTNLLEDWFRKAFAEDSGLLKSYEAEMCVWPITYEMESRGVRCDMEVVDREIEEHRKRVRKWKPVVKEAAWPGFDIESPAQCGRLIYNTLKLPICRRTETGKPQVNFTALEEYAYHPIVSALFKYRASSKALSNFFLKYREFYIHDHLSQDQYVLHPDFNQIGPATGRFSCRRPNFQNTANALTTRSSEPIQARMPFGPRKGYVWYHFDWEGQEVRIFADVSQEKRLIQAIKAGLDAHTYTAELGYGGKNNEMAIFAASHALELDSTGDESNQLVQAQWRHYGIKDPHRLEDKDKERISLDWLKQFNYEIVPAEKSLGKKTSRAKSKMIFFAKIFGGGANAISDLLRCDYDQACEFLAVFDESYPGIVEYIRELSREAELNGYIINKLGRRLSVNRNKPYTAVNYMVQGSAASLIKWKMEQSDTYLKQLGFDYHLLLEVHDELIFEMRKQHVFRSILVELKELLEDHGGLFCLPLPVEVERCVLRWNEKEKIKLN